MPLVIGTDEAGYGPNLGPLVVAATAWRVPNPQFDFYAELAGRIGRDPAPNDPRLVIADSKAVFKTGSSLGRLELAVLALLSTYAKLPPRIPDLIRQLCDSSEVAVPAWYAWSDSSVPVAVGSGELQRQSRALAECLRQKSVQVERIAARLIFPPEYNALVAGFGNKAAALSAITLQLARSLADRHTDDCSIVCDRHGGRARYAPLVQQYLTEELPRVVAETPTCSQYAWSEGDRDFGVRFVVGGESYLPTAAASMTAKYLREVMMLGWNGFWQRHDADLRPTAGYPADAKRFLRDVSPHLTRLGIEVHSIWRER
jgi:hypothetical protein